MADYIFALLMGGSSGLMGIAALRVPLLAWVALAPLGIATYYLPPLAAAIAGATAGALLASSAFTGKPLRTLLFVACTISCIAWGIGFGFGAYFWPNNNPTWGAVILPATSVVVLLPLRLAGAPRWATNPLGRTQERWLTIVHIARLGSDLFIPAALSAISAIIVMLEANWLPNRSTLLTISVTGATVLAALAYGWSSHRRATRRASTGNTIRVAAVVCDGAPPSDPLIDSFVWPMLSPEYTCVQSTLRRYKSHIQAATAAGARVLVLPEVGVRVNAVSRQEWITGICDWAKLYKVTIIAAFLDESKSSNELIIAGPSGNVDARYEKQHTAPKIESTPQERMLPARARVSGSEQIFVSAVICADADYNDLIKPVSRAGGILAVPSNDWPDIEELHCRSAVWTAVMSGVSLIRSTGHGTSAAFEPTGRVITHKSSRHGPVVLVADLPI